MRDDRPKIGFGCPASQEIGHVIAQPSKPNRNAPDASW
jgi:hypothetical protein